MARPGGASMLAEGCSIAAIAKETGVSVRTAHRRLVGYKRGPSSSRHKERRQDEPKRPIKQFGGHDA